MWNSQLGDRFLILVYTSNLGQNIYYLILGRKITRLSVWHKMAIYLAMLCCPFMNNWLFRHIVFCPMLRARILHKLTLAFSLCHLYMP